MKPGFPGRRWRARRLRRTIGLFGFGPDEGQVVQESGKVGVIGDKRGEQFFGEEPVAVEGGGFGPGGGSVVVCVDAGFAGQQKQNG